MYCITTSYWEITWKFIYSFILNYYYFCLVSAYWLMGKVLSLNISFKTSVLYHVQLLSYNVCSCFPEFLYICGTICSQWNPASSNPDEIYVFELRRCAHPEDKIIIYSHCSLKWSLFISFFPEHLLTAPTTYKRHSNIFFWMEMLSCL